VSQFHKSSRKGLSPLVAATLLIAFTLSSAAILTVWVTDITNQQKAESTRFEEKIACAGSNIQANLDFAKWDADNTTFSIYIRNKGVNTILIDEYLVWYEFRSTPVYIDASDLKIEKDKAIMLDINVSKGVSDFGYINISEAGEPIKIKYLTTCDGVFSQVQRPMLGWNTVS